MMNEGEKEELGDFSEAEVQKILMGLGKYLMRAATAEAHIKQLIAENQELRQRLGMPEGEPLAATRGFTSEPEAVKKDRPKMPVW